MDPDGMLALGLRKALGGCASARDVAGVLVDPRLHRWFVVAVESRLHATIMVSLINCHNMQLRFSMVHKHESWQVGFFTLQRDATNSNI